MTYQPIYRDYSCSLSEKNCAKLLRSLAICKGTITCNFTIGNAFPEASVGRRTMFFRLRFARQENLDKFHAMGFETTTPPKIVLNSVEAIE